MTLIYNMERALHKIKIFLFALLCPMIISSCDAFDPISGEKAKAAYLCDYLRVAYKDNSLAFEVAVAQSKEVFVNYFCKIDGIKFPKKGESVEPPRPLPKIMAEVTKGKKIDRCKIRGLSIDQCNCLKSGKPKRVCMELPHKHENYK
jgi:hypothetical protein